MQPRARVQLLAQGRRTPVERFAIPDHQCRGANPSGGMCCCAGEVGDMKSIICEIIDEAASFECANGFRPTKVRLGSTNMERLFDESSKLTLFIDEKKQIGIYVDGLEIVRKPNVADYLSCEI